ncbi:MAG: hypothetical protein OHK0039_23480 [Bacteroidia bacterium]
MLSCLLGCLIPLGLHAQLSPYVPYQYLYDEALELFDKEKYGAAQKKIDHFLEYEEDLRTRGANDLHANARYVQAASAYHLERNDAVSLMKGFLSEFSENTKAPLVQYYLGKYYFGKRKYREAIDPFGAAYRAGRLDAPRLDEVVFLLAYCHYMAKDGLQALRYFDIATRTANPYREDALYYKSVIYYEEGDYEEAYNAFQDLKDSKKYGSEIKVYMANALMKLRRFDELNILADELISGPPLKGNEAQVYYVVANASFEREDYPRTTEFFGRYAKSRGKMGRTDYFRYGYALYQQQKYRDAIPEFQRALTQNDSLSQISSYYLGFCYLEEKDPASAKFAFEKAAQAVGVGNPVVLQDALYQYAKVSFATEAYDDALRAFTQITREYPRAPYIDEVRAMIGETYLYTRDYPRSTSYLESVPLNTPRAKKAYQTVCYYYGLELFERPDYAQAVPYFRKAVNNPYDDNLTLGAQYWLGEAEFRQGNFANARQAFQTFMTMRGAAQHEYGARAYYGLGWSFFKEKNHSQAFKNFETYLAKAGANEPRNLPVDASLRAGDCQFILKNYTQAINYYQKVIDLRYTYRDYAAYQMGEAYYRLTRYTESVQTFDKMIRSFKESELRDNALDRISEIYATWIKDYGSALKYAKMLVDEYPKSPLASDAYNRLALASYNLGNEQAAINYYKKVLSDYAGDRRSAQIALDNLATLLPEAEFDRVLKDYRNRNPQMDNNLASLVFSTGKDRFFSGNYSSAIDQFTTYIRDYKNGANYHESLLFRARCYRETGRLGESLRDYEAVYNTTVSNEFTNVALQEAAEIKYGQKDYLSSLMLYQELEKNAGKLENRVLAWFGIADNHKAMGDYAPAIAALSSIADNNEVQVYSRTRAQVGIGQCQYLQGNRDAARTTFTAVEQEFKNVFGAESQYMLTLILLEEGRELKERGNVAEANAKFEAVKQGTLYMRNNYATFNYWKAKTFLVVADAYYELGNIFQAKGTLESLVKEERFPDIQEEARKRLAEIVAAEGGQ